MKKIILLSFLFLGITKTFSQVEVPLQTCYIKYDYDNVGNRIKRTYYCGGINPNSTSANIGGKILNQNPEDKTSKLEVDNSGVLLFPNPTSNDLKIKVPEMVLGGSITITDLKGVIIKSMKIEDLHSTLDLSGLAPGNYLVIIDSEKMKVSKVILKQ
jgi:hypothetical protein